MYYRLAPENPFPAAVDDVVAVYKGSRSEILPTPQHRNLRHVRRSNLDRGSGRAAQAIGDAAAGSARDVLGPPRLHASHRFAGTIHVGYGFPDAATARSKSSAEDAYAANTDRKDPVLSPIFANLQGWPPSLLVSGTRDLLLERHCYVSSGFAGAHEMTRQLVVFEAMPHAFWYHFQLPETKEALEMMAKFFDEKVGR